MPDISVSSNKTEEKGPFDIIGDIHGCIDELKLLLDKLGYEIAHDQQYKISHPDDRRLVFVGDLVDRGPNSPEVLRVVMDAVDSDQAFCVKGNHDDKLKRKMLGNNVKIVHGLQYTLDQLDNETDVFKRRVLDFLTSLSTNYLLDEGRLAVAHAGIKQKYLGRSSARIDRFCMYGDIKGEIDEMGLPIRYPWAEEYCGETLIVYGHTPVLEPTWINNTINIDTGCVFGGSLTALRYPEKEIVSVKALKTYYDPIKPLE